jgi:hypothetical protein
MAIANTVLSTLDGNIFVSSGNSAITAIYLCNSAGAGTVTINLYAVPSGGTLDATTQIYQNLSLTQGDTYVIDSEKLILENGDYLAGNCSANASVVATVSSIGI